MSDILFYNYLFSKILVNPTKNGASDWYTDIDFHKIYDSETGRRWKSADKTRLDTLIMKMNEHYMDQLSGAIIYAGFLLKYGVFYES